MTEEILDDIYEALAVRGDVASGLACLTSAFNAHAGAMLTLSNGEAKGLATLNVSSESFINYHTEIQPEDWNLQIVNEEPRLPVFRASSKVDLKNVTDTDYHRLVNRPSDIHDTLVLQFFGNKGEARSFSLYKPGREVFSDEEQLLAEKMHSHVARALRLLDRREGMLAFSEPQLEAMEITDKERDILKLMASDMSYAEICAGLSISRNTLKWHMRNIFRKTGARNRAGVVSRLSGFAAAVA